jgi:hypothetical protein
MDDDAVARLLAGAHAAPRQDHVRQVVRWIAFADVDAGDDQDIGGWGGSINKGDGWSEYIANIDEKCVAYYEALRDAILRRGLRRGGDWHQFAPDGVPLFRDGVFASFSFRGWGDLMAAAWADTDGRRHGYMDYYMDGCLEDAGIELSPPLGGAPTM